MQELVSKHKEKVHTKGACKQGTVGIYALKTQEVARGPGNEFNNAYPFTETVS
jgi:hypothetical protein